MNDRFARWLVHNRYLAMILSLATIALMMVGSKNLYYETDYKIFFSADNPQLLAHDAMQDAFTKSDNINLIIGNPKGTVFNQRYLSVIKDITDEAWKLPFSIRVDSLTNFQHTHAEGDELIVEDLVPNTEALDATELKRIRGIAMNENQLVDNLLGKKGDVSLIQVSLELPPAVDLTADRATQDKQRAARDGSFVTVLEATEKLRDKIVKENPDYIVHIMGLPAINQAFDGSSKRDASTLIPLMYVIIIVLLALFLRSISSVVTVAVVIGAATLATIGFTGWLNVPMNQINISAPVIILTIAVCDCVHILALYLRDLRNGMSKLEAMKSSLSINLQPIFLTSLTTVIGFLSLNFSDSPPFQELGTICAMGVFLAMVFSVTMLPMLAIWLCRRPKKRKEKTYNPMSPLADFVIKHRHLSFWGTLVVSLALISQLGNNIINDDSISYFNPGIPIRDAADYSEEHLTGVHPVEYNLECGEAGCVNDPAFLKKVQAFGEWYKSVPEIQHVSSYVDVITRLNKNMHGGDAAYERIPESKELAAQYQLLYEMSLPYGLDLNNQVNFDKSGLRLIARANLRNSERFIEIDQQAQDWLAQNAPELKTAGSSVPMMFAHIGSRNIKSMITGSIIALLGITLTLLIALRSVKFGLLSLIPNAFPAAMALGIWSFIIGEVNLAVAVVFSVTLGIVVDDTVHFLSKYLRARRVDGKSPEDAVRYAFSTVGSALVITSVVLSTGFGLLLLSDFNVNVYMGAMTAITIIVAVVFDFLFLPALLLLTDRK